MLSVVYLYSMVHSSRKTDVSLKQFIRAVTKIANSTPVATSAVNATNTIPTIDPIFALSDIDSAISSVMMPGRDMINNSAKKQGMEMQYVCL